jgi:transcriptional regulator with XRE-family HTH domain
MSDILLDVDSFAKTLKALRARRQLTQADLATQAGISRGYLIRLEQGTQDPTLGVLRRLAKALNVPLTRLVR